MKMSSIVDKILHLPGFYQAYNLKENLKKMELTYKLEDLNDDYYSKIKDIGSNELEHQIGRLKNFKKIVSACHDLEGDFIEFGSWKGFSLLWIAYFMERNAIFNKKLIGIDGFIGLPYADGGFSKGMFADTSLNVCRKNVLQNSSIYAETRKNIFVEKFLYKDNEKIGGYLNKLGSKKFCFIHIDCDVSKSAEEIFFLLDKYNLIADEAFILFDDYGWDTGIKEVIEVFLEKNRKEWIIEEHSQTRFTKNYFFKKK
jgi:hypothetical protein